MVGVAALSLVPMLPTPYAPGDRVLVLFEETGAVRYAATVVAYAPCLSAAVPNIPQDVLAYVDDLCEADVPVCVVCPDGDPETDAFRLPIFMVTYLRPTQETLTRMYRTVLTHGDTTCTGGPSEDRLPWPPGLGYRSAAPNPLVDRADECTDWSHEGWVYYKRVRQMHGCGFQAMRPGRECLAPSPC